MLYKTVMSWNLDSTYNKNKKGISDFLDVPFDIKNVELKFLRQG
jgi:hypothetical protein